MLKQLYAENLLIGQDQTDDKHRILFKPDKFAAAKCYTQCKVCNRVIKVLGQFWYSVTEISIHIIRWL